MKPLHEFPAQYLCLQGSECSLYGFLHMRVEMHYKTHGFQVKYPISLAWSFFKLIRYSNTHLFQIHDAIDVL